MTDPQPPVPPADDSAPPPPAPGYTPPPAAPAYTAPAASDYTAPPAAPAAQPVYPAYGQPAQGYYAPPTNTLAILALVFAFIISLGGIICGHIALNQIKRTGEGGRGLALAGLIIGYVFTGFWLLYFIVLIGGLIWASSYNYY